MTIADGLNLALQTKNGLKGVIEDNGGTAPTKFSQYPAVLDTLMDNMRDQLKITDKVIINKDTTLDALNSFFDYVPTVPAGSSITTQATAKILAANLNVRADGNSSANMLGLLVSGDVVNVYGTASSGWYKINQWRNSSTGALTNHGTTYGYISNNTTLVFYTPGSTSSTKKIIDISATSATVQQKCNYVLAQTKGWDVVFSSSYTPGSSGNTGATTTERTTTYAFNNYFTDQYKNSTYTSYSNTMSNELRQGYWSGYYYYKGNFRFTSSRLTEIKNLLKNSTIKSIQVYVQRNSNSGTSGTANLKLYACDSTGTNADVLVNGTATLARGAGIWTTLSTNVANGFKTGKYDHFKAYYPSTSTSYYMVFELNAQLKITYTA